MDCVLIIARPHTGNTFVDSTAFQLGCQYDDNTVHGLQMGLDADFPNTDFTGFALSGINTNRSQTGFILGAVNTAFAAQKGFGAAFIATVGKATGVNIGLFAYEQKSSNSSLGLGLTVYGPCGLSLFTSEFNECDD